MFGKYLNIQCMCRKERAINLFEMHFSYKAALFNFHECFASVRKYDELNTLFLARAQCVIFYGQIQMIVVAGVSLRVVLATHLDKTFLKHLTMPMVLRWSPVLTNLLWRYDEYFLFYM